MGDIGIVTVVYIVIGLVLIGFIALKPKLFWPVLVVVAVGTAGLMLQGYALVDEYLTGCVLIGGLLAISVGAARLQWGTRDDLSYLHMLAFSLMIVYMIVESIRGLLLWEDLELSRWVVYYVMLGVLSFIISTGDFPVPNLKKMSLIIVWSALLYFIAYLGQGSYAEAFRGISRFATQGIEWSGSAYAVFPSVAAIPAAIFLLKGNARSQRWLGLALLIISIVVGAYYSCRSAWITIIAFLIVTPTAIKLRHTALWLLILAILAILAFFVFNYTVSDFQRLFQSALLRDVAEEGRLMMFEAAVNAVSANWATLFFGYGIHSHHFVIGPYLQALGYFQGASSVPSYIRITGASGLLVDIGLIGMLLLFASFLFTAFKIIAAKRSPGRIVLLLSLFLVFVWPLISKIDDIVLFYLMIMPSGLLVHLSRLEPIKEPLLDGNQTSISEKFSA